MRQELDLRVFGPLEVLAGGRPLSVGGARRRGVLAMLALEPGRVVSADRLIAGVWGEEPPNTAATALHGHVSQLRRQLGEAIVTRAPGYVLDVEPDAVDFVRCERLVERGREALAGGDARSASDLLGAAVALTRGAPLADLADAPFAPSALPWLGELSLGAREEWAEAQLALGRHEELIAELKGVVAEDPLRERPRAQLMLALYRSGRGAEALQCYDDARRTLVEELGVEPGDRLRDLHAAILREDPELGRTPRRHTPPPPPPAGRRSRRWLLAGIAAVLLAVVAVVVVLAGGGDDEAKPSASLAGDGVQLIDPGAMRVAAAAPVSGTPTSIAAAGDRAWTINADDQTITEISGEGRVVRKFAAGASPVDLAAAGDDLWVAQGTVAGTQSLAPQARSVAHLTGAGSAVRRTVRLPGARGQVAPVTTDGMALAGSEAWAIAGDGTLSAIDERSDEIVRVLRINAVALATLSGRVWALTGDGTLLPVDARSPSSGAPLDVPGDPGGLTAGGGALYVLDHTAGTLVRIDARDPSARRSAKVGTGAVAVAYGHDAVWVADAARGRVTRLDPVTLGVSGSVDVGAVPRELAVSSAGVWVSTGPAVAGGTTATASCSATRGRGASDVVLVAELPLQRDGRSPTAAMARAIATVLERRGFRAGRHAIGYRLCDDSTAQAATWDAAKCVANARAYAADPDVVLELGPYNSECARRQMPIAASAPHGPLAMLSASNTSPLLTRGDMRRTEGAYARIIARDDAQGRAMAEELRARGAHSVYVLDDAGGSGSLGLDLASYFAAAARGEGLRIAGRASWGRERSLARLARRVAAARPDAVYVSGQLDTRAGAMTRALRAALPAGTTLAGPDLVLPVAGLVADSRGGARGMLLTSTFLPAQALTTAGRRLGVELGEAGVRAAQPAALYAAQAAEVALDAIGRSDGSRRSVAQALRSTDMRDTALGRVAFDARGDLRGARIALWRVARGGGSRDLLSTDGATYLRAR